MCCVSGSRKQIFAGRCGRIVGWRWARHVGSQSRARMGEGVTVGRRFGGDLPSPFPNSLERRPDERAAAQIECDRRSRCDRDVGRGHGASRRSLRSATIRSSEPIRRGTTPSSTRRTTLEGSSAPSPPTPAARTRATRRSSAWRASPNHPAEPQLRPDAVLGDDGADRGILFFCLQANLARGFEFVKTQWINEGTFCGTPPRWTRWSGRTRGPGCSPSPSNRSAGASPSCPGSWSTAAGSTHLCPACRPCAGSPTSETQAELQARAPRPGSPSGASSRRGPLADEEPHR
jgi:hypothetical protein